MIFEERHFEYGDFCSREYGLIFAHVDTQSFLQVAGTIDTVGVFNKRDYIKYPMRSDYSNSPISFDIEIVNECGDAIQHEDRRVIERALFNKHGYKKMYIDIEDDAFGETYEFVDGEQKRLYMNCRFMNPERIENGNGLVVGYKCTIESDRGYLTQDQITKTFSDSDISDGSGVVSINVDTDVDEYIYPIINIISGSTGGTISIINNTDDSARVTKFITIPPSSTITMNGTVNYISGQYYDKFAKQNFVRLLDGENSITVSGDVDSISFTWSNRRFL